MNLIMSIWTDGDFIDRNRLRQTFRDNYHHVRSVVHKHKLLEFIFEDDYKKLCNFFGELVPDEEPFPHID